MENIGNDAASPDESSGWHSIDWKVIMKFVGKAQMRIAQAEQEKDFRRVARLTRSLIRSWQAKALAVRKSNRKQREANEWRRSRTLGQANMDVADEKWATGRSSIAIRCVTGVSTP
jgi:RNA-directed DNA polymerase